MMIRIMKTNFFYMFTIKFKWERFIKIEKQAKINVVFFLFVCFHLILVSFKTEYIKFESLITPTQGIAPINLHIIPGSEFVHTV